MWLHAYLVVSSKNSVCQFPFCCYTEMGKMRKSGESVSVCVNGQFEYNALENAFAMWKPFYLNAYAKWRKQQQQHKSSVMRRRENERGGDKEVGSICMQQPHQMIYFIVQSNEVSNELQLQHSQSNSYRLTYTIAFWRTLHFFVCVNVQCAHTRTQILCFIAALANFKRPTYE